jgi:hypothetical protein
MINTDDMSSDNYSGVVGVSGAVQGTAGYRGCYWTSIGRTDGQFYYCTQNENINHFVWCTVGECTVQMRSG